MLALASRDHWLDAALTDEPAVLVVVVAAVGDDAVGAFPRSADTAADRRHAVEQLEQLGDVVAIAARERPGERQSAAVYEEGLLAAAPAAIDGAGTRLRAPFFAWMWLESATARDHSISPEACNSASSNSCNRCQTPASCQARNLRQHVMPQPKPSSCGRCSQPIPVCKTNKIPCNASRSSNGLRPGYRKRRCRRGKSGSIRPHNASDTSHGFARIGIPPKA